MAHIISLVTAGFRQGGREAARKVALGLGVLDPARTLYQRAFNRPYHRYLRQQQRMLEGFVQPGSLVFDVGANVGEWSLVFNRIGARVVLVEPNPTLASQLRKRFRHDDVIEAAIGSRVGRATLHIGLDSNYSTVSDAWRGVVAERNRLSADTVEVELTTLDVLIERLGLPDFAKIDIEGSELEAFRGLTKPINAILFEFQCPLLADFEASLHALEQVAPYEYAAAGGGDMTWLGRSAMVSRVKELCDAGAGSGDVIARRHG